MHTLALDKFGRVYGFDKNYYGVNDDIPDVVHNIPILIYGVKDIKCIKADNCFSFFGK